MAMRPAAVAGSWYPGSAGALSAAVDGYVAAADVPPLADIRAVMAPHAGLMFSGPVAAYAYKAAARQRYDVILLVGPSHFVGFDGVSIWPSGGFDSPLGPALVDEAVAGELLHSPVVHALDQAHRREHSLEMQLPFLRRLLPDVPIVPLLMGYQERETIERLADALVASSSPRRALLVASTDLSHYMDAATAASLDGRVQDCVAGFDPDALLDLFERYPEHDRGRYVACGGGPAIAVMKAAKRLGAEQGRVLKYAHSGEVSGDYEGVVGYLAAAFGRFPDAD
jgi:AmmeMemoRadiSam system protein B